MNIRYVVLICLFLLLIYGYSGNKRAKKKVVRVIDDNCTGCGRCLKICRHKALDMAADDAARHIALKYPEKCTACGDCVTGCKFNALELVNRNR